MPSKIQVSVRSYATPMGARHPYGAPEHQPPARTVVLLLKSDYHKRTLRRIIERATERNWRVMNLKYQNNHIPDDIKVDGAFTDALWDDPFTKQLRDLNIPAVRIGRFAHPKDNILPAVVPDLTVIGHLAAEHFAERLFRHVGFISYQLSTSHHKHIYDPFVAKAAECNCKPHLLEFRLLRKQERHFSHDKRQAIRDKELARWLKSVPKPIGILGFNDELSAKVCAFALNQGFSVASEIAIVSCGNNPLVCECTPIRLSGISTSGPDEGDAAVELLDGLMNGMPKPQETIFVAPKRITIRESSDVLATTDPDIAQAIRFIWNNLRQSISVDDVANAVSIPRRTLERKFQLQLGRGINAELLRRRLEYCCDLLRSTDLPVVDIVALIGIRSNAYLHRVFLRTFGMTPLQWRDTRHVSQE